MDVGCAYRKSNPTRQRADIGRCFLAMADILRLICGAIADFFRSRADLQTEIVVLRHLCLPQIESDSPIGRYWAMLSC